MDGWPHKQQLLSAAEDHLIMSLLAVATAAAVVAKCKANNSLAARKMSCFL